MNFFFIVFIEAVRKTLKMAQNVVNNQNERKKINNNWMSWELIYSNQMKEKN